MDTVKGVLNSLEATTYYCLYIDLSDGNTLPKVYPETTLLSVLYEEVEAVIEMPGVSNVVLSQVVGGEEGEKDYILGSWIQDERKPDRLHLFPKSGSYWSFFMDILSGYEEVIVVGTITDEFRSTCLVRISRANGLDFSPGKPDHIYELGDFMKKATPIVKLPEET